LIVSVAEPTLIVPLRAAPVLPATLNPTVPLPVPVAPEVIEIHDAPLVAAQPQDAPLETLTEPVLAPTATSTLVGSRLSEQPAWLIVSVAEPTLIVLLRAAPVLPATLNPTVPFPAPVAPEVIAIHDAPLVAVQLQDAALETLTVPVLAETTASTVVGLRLTEHPLAWLIVVVAEPTVIVPLRGAPLLGATVKPMLALPEPAGDVIVIQDAVVVADHAHVVVSARKKPVPPAAGIASAGGVSP